MQKLQIMILACSPLYIRDLIHYCVGYNDFKSKKYLSIEQRHKGILLSIR